ncbi:MAG: DNA-directed RNA polymerase subunit omega [Symbiobacteriaceae bacterium]|nr:DNA-directed RNA polymerase subunit omega [Symbiobacteriaceae bacterium]
MPEYIPSDEMYKFIDCRYTGVVVTARRARQLMMEDPTSAKGKPLLRAFDDLMQGKLHYQFVDPLEYEEEYGEGVYYPQEDPPQDTVSKSGRAKKDDS